MPMKQISLATIGLKFVNWRTPKREFPRKMSLVVAWALKFDTFPKISFTPAHQQSIKSTTYA